jgi:hypothetical protein
MSEEKSLFTEVDGEPVTTTNAEGEAYHEVPVVQDDGPVNIPSIQTARDPLEMIAAAINRGIDADTMQKMLDMRMQLKAEEAQEAYFDALSQFQSALPQIPKTKEVKDKSGKVRYKYSPLDVIIQTVKPLLQKYGFSYTMKPVQEEAGQLTAVIVSHHKDGHSEETRFMVPIDDEAYMNAPQKVGSARTFAMRYAFCNAFGILTSDQDNDAEDGSFSDGVRYADYVHAIDAETNVESLLMLVRGFGETLKEQGDEHGRDVLRHEFDRRKKEIQSGAANG